MYTKIPTVRFIFGATLLMIAVKFSTGANEKHLNHYTTVEGARAIHASQQIRGSTPNVKNTNTRHGTGVYTTAIRPKAGIKKILTNNYQTNPKAQVSDKYVDRNAHRNALAVKIPKQQMGGANKVDSKGRNIYLDPSRNFNLQNVDYKIKPTKGVPLNQNPNSPPSFRRGGIDYGQPGSQSQRNFQKNRQRYKPY